MKRKQGQVSRFLAAFAGVLVAYGLYARFAIPWIEGPSRRVRDSSPVSGDLNANAPDLSPWLPAGAWELQPCKRLDTEAGHLLFQDYLPHDDGRVEVRPLTLLYRPEGDPPESPPIVLRSEQGAVLKFDAPLSLSGKAGQLEGAMFYGPVEIYRRASAPDRRDDWRVVTSEVQLNNERIQTLQNVQFQFGPNVGQGRHLIVTLDRDPLRAGQKTLAAVRGVARIELVQISQLQLVAPAGSRLTGAPAGEAAAAAAPVGVTTTASDPPSDQPTVYRVTCAGPLTVDMHTGIGSLNDRVEMLSIDDPRDWMRADRLELTFGGGPSLSGAAAEPTAPAAGGDEARPGPQNWSVQSVAVVGQPAQINFPSRQVSVLGERLAYDFGRNAVRIRSAVAQPLRQGDFELTAMDLEYQRMEDGSMGPTVIRGPGRLLQTTEAGQPPLAISWQQGLSIEIQGSERKLTILGSVVASLDPTTTLETDQIELWFRPRRDAVGAQASMEPIKLIATGQVHVAADRIDVRVNQLLAHWPDAAAIHPQASRAGTPRSTYVGAANQDSAVAQPSSGASQPAAVADRAAVPDRTAQAGGVGGVANRLPLLVRGEIATLRFAPPPAGGGDESSENGIQVQEITIDGNILLQQRNPLNQEIELQIEGDQLKVVPQDATHRRVSVHGNSNRPVTIVAAELSMRSDQVTVDQKANRLWIDGSGNVRGQLAGALNSLATGEANRAAEPAANAAFAVNSTLAPTAPTAAARQLNLDWSGGMVFDGQQVYFESGVIAVIEEPAETGLVRTRVQCEALNLGLEQRIDLSGSGESVSVADPTSNGARVESITVARELPADQRVFAAPAVNAAASEKGSLLERQVLDAQQALQQVQRFDVPWLQIQVGTGKVQTNGPGSLAVWLPASQMKQMSSTLATAPPRDGWGNTQIKFDQGIEGDLHRSDFTFRNNVRVLHGSVTGPDESLDADRSELIGDRYRLRANELRVVQWQKSTEVEPHLEMIAQGQLQLDGELFSALAQRLSFDQSREILVLEGDARSQARLEYQTAPGAPRNPLVAAKIKYRLRDQAAEAEGITHGVLSTGPLLERK